VNYHHHWIFDHDASGRSAEQLGLKHMERASYTRSH